MKSLITFKKMKKEKTGLPYPHIKPSKGCEENILTPITLFGVIVPWSRGGSPTGISEYKLVCTSGLEYFLVANDEWLGILSWYSWNEVKVVGLLNAANLTLIPQKVFPRGPKGEKENVFDLALCKSKEVIKKISKNINDLSLARESALECLAS